MLIVLINAITVIGGRHFVITSITNNTVIGEDAPVIRAVLDYGGSAKGKTVTSPLPIREKLYMYDAADDELAEQTYFFDLDMDAIWEEGLKDGLRGISFSLVNAEGEQQSNEIVYLTNPAETRTEPEPAHVCPSARFTDFDPDAWYHEAVDYAVMKGLMNGVASDKFAPNGTTTRAMLVTILHRGGRCPPWSARERGTSPQAPYPLLPRDTRKQGIWSCGSLPNQSICFDLERKTGEADAQPASLPRLRSGAPPV